MLCLQSDLIRVDVEGEAVLLADHLVAPHPRRRLQALPPLRGVQRPLPPLRLLGQPEPQLSQRGLRVRNPREGVELLSSFRPGYLLITGSIGYSDTV